MLWREHSANDNIVDVIPELIKSTTHSHSNKWLVYVTMND